MDANELRRIELVRHPADRLAEQISILSRNMQSDVVCGCLDPVDFIHLNEDHTSPGLDNQPVLGVGLPRGRK